MPSTLMLHDEVLYNLLSMNTRIYELMDGFYEKPTRTTGRSRRDIFEAEEQPTLGKLPMTPYRFRYRKEVKLSGTYHVMVDKHNYSVPYQYVGQKVSVQWNLDTVKVYSGSSRIAIHQRRQGSGYSTLDEHMPDKHLSYKHGQGYNAAYFPGGGGIGWQQHNYSSPIHPQSHEACRAVVQVLPRSPVSQAQVWQGASEEGLQASGWLFIHHLHDHPQRVGEEP